MFDIPEDGFVKVKLGATEKDVDLYQLYNRIVDAAEASDGTVSGQQAAAVKVLAEFGFPGASCRTADRLVKALYDRVEELKKNGSGPPTPGTASTSGPDSSPSPPA